MSEPPHIARLHWDAWNREHLQKHAVSPEEAEEVAENEPVVRETYKQRLQLIGRTRARRVLTVIVGQVPGQAGVYYVFSARPASRQERRFYEQQRGGPTP